MHQMNRKISVGVLWNLASMLLSRGSSTIFTLILARLLAPESFGLIAMMMIVLELAHHFVQSGLGQALIRSKEVSDVDLSTVFVTNLSISVLAYFLLYIGAPWLSEFYEQPELTNLLRVIGIVIFFNALKVVPIAILSRRMNFRSQMLVETFAVLVSGVIAISLASNDFGVWSLVGQSITTACISAGLLLYVTSWKPKLSFCLASFQRHFAFGMNLLIIGTIRILVQNSYVMVIGRFFSAEVTGLYFLAKKVSQLISQQLSGAVQKATYPAMATLQDDNTLLRKKYRQIIQVMLFIIAPIMLLLAALSKPLFSLILGSEWMEAVVYLQLLCMVAILYPIHAMNINVLKVKGRSDLVLKIGLLKNTSSLILLFIALPYGVFWIVVSQLVNSLISLIPNTYFTVRLIGYGLKEQMLDIFKPVVAAGASSLIVFFVVETAPLSDVYLLMSGVLLGGFTFLITSLVLRIEALTLILTKVRG